MYLTKAVDKAKKVICRNILSQYSFYCRCVVCFGMISLLTKDKSFKLLESIGELRSEEAFHDVNLICQDGNIKTSGLLLASISPLFKLIGSCHHPRLLAGETTVILPDVSVKCLEQFLQSIVSPVPPHDPEQIQVIQDLLQFIGHGAHQNSEQKTAKKKLFKEDKVCPNADNDKNDDLMDESWNGHCDNSSLENEVGNGSVNSKCKVNLKGPKLKSMDVKEINDALDGKLFILPDWYMLFINSHVLFQTK